LYFLEIEEKFCKLFLVLGFVFALRFY